MKKKLILILVIVILIVLEGFIIFSLNKDNDKQDIINLNVNDSLFKSCIRWLIQVIMQFYSMIYMVKRS